MRTGKIEISAKQKIHANIFVGMIGRYDTWLEMIMVPPPACFIYGSYIVAGWNFEAYGLGSFPTDTPQNLTRP